MLADFLVIYPDETIITVQLDSKDKALAKMNEIVNGYIQVINNMSNNKTLIINEEGKLLNLPINKLATEIYKLDIIVGAALCIDTNKFIALDNDYTGEGE